MWSFTKENLIEDVKNNNGTKTYKFSHYCEYINNDPNIDVYEYAKFSIPITVTLTTADLTSENISWVN